MEIHVYIDNKYFDRISAPDRHNLPCIPTAINGKKLLRCESYIDSICGQSYNCYYGG